MIEMLPRAMIHRPLHLPDEWRAGVLDVIAEEDPTHTLPVGQASFVVRITTGLQAEALAEEMDTQNITEGEVLGAIEKAVPSSTENMPFGVDRARAQTKAAQSKLFMDLERNGDFTEEWRQIDVVLDELIPGRKDSARAPRMRLAQSSDRAMIVGMKNKLNGNPDAVESTIELAGVRMGDSEGVVASYNAGIERRIRRATLTQYPFTPADLFGWVESSPYSAEEIGPALLAAEQAGRLVVEEAAEAGLVYQFVG